MVFIKKSLTYYSFFALTYLAISKSAVACSSSEQELSVKTKNCLLIASSGAELANPITSEKSAYKFNFTLANEATWSKLANRCMFSIKDVETFKRAIKLNKSVIFQTEEEHQNFLKDENQCEIERTGFWTLHKPCYTIKCGVN